MVRADEAHHRDVNHGFASDLAGAQIESGRWLPIPTTPTSFGRQPDMAVPYRSTPVFNEKTLPAALRGEHKTKAGVWGVIQVIEGELGFSLADGEGGTLQPIDKAWPAPPSNPHWVEPIGAMRMQVHFYDQRPDDLSAHHRDTGPGAPAAVLTT